ncbi:nuclear fragile X mental retardation-interacting protein 1-domain-containing protein [Mycena leptocephala]|nr:nuclear fragile X mental retardation-interacting protein 1-domain-containing protein [Mycena leptocephala]
MQQPPWPQHSYYSSHYAQAYIQHTFPAAATTPQGYSLSSTYNSAVPQNAPSYQSGNSRCTYKTCTFRGSPQTVETHMMDRHLIFPPGWEKRNKKPEWDADPSLKGKPIPIQGTTIMLDSPEEVEAWIAERKRRWPSAPRVEEKKRKMDEAVARGQLRWRTRDSLGGNGGARMTGTQTVDAVGPQHARAGGDAVSMLAGEAVAEAPGDRDDSDDDGAPEIVSSKSLSVAAPPPEILLRFVHNPFASRPTLLRNLLLPEIRITVSNLSQAIRFLVDNDFLQNVELKPGQANNKLIEVLREDEGEDVALTT